MADCILIKLKNMTPLHIGTGKENYDFAASTLQSDTLSAALVAMKAQKDGASEDLSGFLASFTLSSAFPYVGSRYFMPKPMGRVNMEITDCNEYIAKKKIKKLKFIEWELWKELVAGKKLSVKDGQLQDGFLWTDGNDEHRECPYRSQVSQRVAVPLDGGADAEPFFFEWTYFQENAGLYCLLQAPLDKQDELIDLFRQLGECGIGTDKSVGGGKFEVETEPLSLPEVTGADAVLLLSLYIPTEEELSKLQLTDSCYDLLLRGGYIAGSSEVHFMHLRKKSVYMFNVGSIFRTSDALYGKVVDLRPEWNGERLHPVLRSGKPFIAMIKQPKP